MAIAFKLQNVELSIDVNGLTGWKKKGPLYQSRGLRVKIEKILNQTDSITLRIKIDRVDKGSFLLKKINIQARVPVLGIHGCWIPGLGEGSHPATWNLNSVKWRFGTTVASNFSLPLICLIDRNMDNRFTIGFLEQELETEIKGELSQSDGLYFLTLQRPLEGIRKKRVEHVEHLYLSKVKDKFYRVVGDYRAKYDSIFKKQSIRIPSSAYDPVYCTWYVVHNCVDQKFVERAARKARDLGFRTFIIDDGWCTEKYKRVDKDIADWYADIGEWKVARNKFPDFKATVEHIHQLGMKCILWISPFMVGKNSRSARRLGKLLLPKEVEGYKCWCPRVKEGHEKILDIMEELMRDYDIDGFKFDFVNGVDLSPCHERHNHDFESAGEGLSRFLEDSYKNLSKIKKDVLIAQLSVNLLARRFSTQFRGGDTPFDFDSNREHVAMNRIVLGNDQPVQFDPAFWRADETPENVSRHMINSIFAVPMVSIDFDSLPGEHLKIIKTWLLFYEKYREVLTRGDFKPLMVNGYFAGLQLSSSFTQIMGLFGDGIRELDLIRNVKELIIANAGNEKRLNLELGKKGRRKCKAEVYDKFGVLRSHREIKFDKLDLEVEIGGFCRLLFAPGTFR